MDKIDIIEKMTPHVNQLAKSLEPFGISFFPTDGDLENVIFVGKNKIMKISHNVFYRYSGICKILIINSKKGKNEIEWMDVTDQMYICSYMNSIINKYFDLN